MNPHVSVTTLGVGVDQRPGAKGSRAAGKFGLDPRRLDDEALERELRYLYATREETFFHGTRQALANHTERMLQLERDARAPGCGRGSRPAGRPWRNVEASLLPMRYRRRIVPVGNPPDGRYWQPPLGDFHEPVGPTLGDWSKS